jgi:ATP-dependent helicase/nuclease subunit A
MQSPASEYVKKIVKAGAGAGKTHDLIEKIYRMVTPLQSPHIIVCTFTKKATQELKERLIKKTITHKDDDPQKFKTMLNFIKSSAQLHISTIHGVLTLLLQNFGGAIGLDSQFSIVEDTDCLKLRKQIFFGFIDEKHEAALALYSTWGWEKLALLLAKHREALAFNQNLKPLPAETIIENQSERQMILVKNIYDLLVQLEDHALKNQSSALFNFFTQLKSFNQYFEKIKFPNQEVETLIQLYNQIPQRLGALKGVADETKELKKQVHEEVKEFLDDPFLKPDALASFGKQIELFHKFSIEFNHKLESKKIELAELAISDLEIISLNLLHQFPLTAELFAQKWDYWFIDEFQDTSPIQLKLLKSLIGDKSYYLVGDPQQSIYFFRGARSQIFKNEWHHLLNDGHVTEEKVINRRSQARLLHFINDFMTSLNSKQFSEMIPFHPATELTDPVAEIHISKSPDITELELLINKINYLLDQNVVPSQIAVLCRENNDLIEILKQAYRVKAPMKIVGKGNFYDRLEVNDALTLHRFLNNPHDDQNLLCLLRGPFFHIDDNILLNFSKRKDSLWSDLTQTDFKHLITNLVTALQSAEEIGIFQAWLELLKQIHFIEYYQNQDPSGISEANLWKLIHLVKENALAKVPKSEACALPAQSEDAIQLMTVHASKGLEFDYVLLPFLDGATRKTYPENLVLDLDSTLFALPLNGVHPNWSYKIADQINLFLQEENERLLYVAVTRAKRQLCFFLNTDHLDTNSPWLKHINRFLKKEAGLFEVDNKYSFLIKVENFKA